MGISLDLDSLTSKTTPIGSLYQSQQTKRICLFCWEPAVETTNTINMVFEH